MLDAAAQEAGTAIVTVGHSSEGSDRSEADYYLTDAEKELITRVGANLTRLSLCWNVGCDHGYQLDQRN